MFFPKIYIILIHPEKNIRSLFTTSKSIRCHIGPRHTNISQKTSSSFSSTHGPPSIEFEAGIHRSFKKSSSSQTSTEKLSEKIDSSCSPIRDEFFGCFHSEQQMELLNGFSDDIIMNKSYQIIKNVDYQRVPTTPSHVKLRNNKIFSKESLRTGKVNLHHSMKPHRVPKKHHKRQTSETQKTILCEECLEMEKRNGLKDDETQVLKPPKKSPIFTVEKLPLETKENLFKELRKIDISEESLSECSISEQSAYKLKRITIQLK